MSDSRSLHYMYPSVYTLHLVSLPIVASSFPTAYATLMYKTINVSPTGHHHHREALRPTRTRICFRATSACRGLLAPEWADFQSERPTISSASNLKCATLLELSYPSYHQFGEAHSHHRPRSQEIADLLLSSRRRLLLLFAPRTNCPCMCGI